MFFAYIYHDPRPHKLEPIYVGKGTGVRHEIHLKGSHNPHLESKLKKIKAAGLVPKIEVIPALDEAHAFFLEECLIEVIGRADQGRGPLTNMTDGGEGVSGVIMSVEARAKMSASRMGKSPWNKGSKLPADVRSQIAAALTGKTASDETRAKMSATKLGKKLKPRTAEHAANLAAASTGKKASPETRAKMAESHKRRHAARKLAE